MEYCKYHPLTPAEYHCDRCGNDTCSNCVDDSGRHFQKKCFSCGRELESYGASNTAIPFWRRLRESFQYALTTPVLIGIAIFSVLITLVKFAPLGVVFFFLLVGVFSKYCFRCLVDTSEGKMDAPDMAESFEGGFKVLLHMVGMVLILALCIGLSERYIGPGFSSFLSLLLVCGAPAFLVSYAMNENILEALNPLTAVKLIKAIGFPYGLLLAIITVMFSSISLLNALLSYVEIPGIYIIQNCVFCFYLIVIFHITGYVLFQYQRELGYVASHQSNDLDAVRSAFQFAMTKIDITLKEGDFNGVKMQFELIQKQFPLEPLVYSRYFDFLIAMTDVEALQDFSTGYLDHLSRIGRNDKMRPSYKTIKTLIPNFIPESAEMRVALAMIANSQGDFLEAVQLLNNLHKSHPDFPELVSAYTLLKSAMAQLPSLAHQLPKCDRLIERVARQLRDAELKKQREKEEDIARLAKSFEPDKKRKSKRIPPRVKPNESAHEQDASLESVFSIEDFNRSTGAIPGYVEGDDEGDKKID